MYKYVELCRCGSPMAEILDRVDKNNLRLVVYHLSENHVECATDPQFAHLNLGEIVDDIRDNAQHDHAILAIDIRRNEVYLIEDVPELNAASAVLLCVVTELLNGCVMARTRNDRDVRNANVQPREANGRFAKRTTPMDDDPWDDDYDDKDDEAPRWEAPCACASHRFHIGRH